MKKAIDVIVVGGGIGGLCLAQGLKKAGVGVSVFERDESPTARPQGYRIHISPSGSQALHSCLPPEIFQAFDDTCGDFGQGFTMMSEDLREILSVTGIAERLMPTGINRHRSVSRLTLKRILVAGLSPNVQYGKRFAAYEEIADGRIRVSFEDGTSAEGDVLVGADGVNSPVRQQYLPHAQPFDTGIRILGGKIPLTDGVIALIPHKLLDGPVMIMPKKTGSLFMAVWRRPQDKGAILDSLPGAEYFLGADLEEQEDGYVIFGFGAPTEAYGFKGDPTTLPKSELQDTLRRMVAEWHPNFRKLVELIDPNSLGGSMIRSSKPVEPWKPSRVTLIGDAIHNMTPYRGIGANVALKDADLLASKLAGVSEGKQELLTAIGEYESEMRDYAFRAVKDSLATMHQATTQKNFGFAVFKSAMRTINAFPSMKHKVFLRMADA